MNEIFVVPFYGNWAIMLSGKDMPLSTHNRKDDAIRVATQLSKRHNSKVIVKDNEQPGQNNEE